MPTGRALIADRPACRCPPARARPNGPESLLQADSFPGNPISKRNGRGRQGQLDAPLWRPPLVVGRAGNATYRRGPAGQRRRLKPAGWHTNRVQTRSGGRGNRLQPVSRASRGFEPAWHEPPSRRGLNPPRPNPRHAVASTRVAPPPGRVCAFFLLVLQCRANTRPQDRDPWTI